MALQSFVYLRPDSDSAFETFCLKVFRTYLKLSNLQKFARPGHRQFGVDLVSITLDRIVGIQCKLKNTATGLTVAEIDDEVERAKTFNPPLTEYIIATTADREPVLQQHVLRISQRHHAAGLFSVTIYAWQDIEEILKQDFYLATELYSIPAPSSVSTIDVVSQATITSQAPSGGAHAEIDEAAQHLTDKKPDVALALLRRLKRDRWEFLTARERFRVLANIGNALLQRGEQDEAAISFLEAATHQPEDADALSVAAQGHLLSGNAEEAYRVASESCSLNPYNERGQRIRILSAPKDMTIKELSAMVPDVLRSELNVAMSLYERAIDEGDPIEAESALRIAKGDSVVLQFSLGVALLQQGLPVGMQERLLSLPRDPSRLREAREYFSVVIDSPDATPAMVAGAYHNRALTFALLNDEDQGFADFRSAHEREPDNEIYSIAFMREALRQGENGSALTVAREFSKKNPSPLGRLMASTVLHDSEGEEDKRQALALLQGGLAHLESAEPEIRLDYIGRTLHLLHASGSLTENTTQELIEKLSDPLERGVIKSWALLRAGRQGEAEAEAKQTASLLNETASIVAKRGVAFLLSRLGLSEEALPIWLEVCPPRSFNEDTLLVLQVAEEIGADEVILDYCEKLRSNGVYSPEVARKEIKLITRYNELRKAQSVIREYLDANPTNLSLRLELLHVAVIKGWSTVLDEYFVSAPSSKEIKTATDGARLVHILNFKGMVGVAVEIAYELVRRFPDDPNSHRVLITSVLGLGGSKGDLNLDAPSEAQIGSAVRIRRTGQEPSEWIVIENSEKPTISRDEYAPNHPLAKALLGKKKGETITFPGFAGEQAAVIEEIKNKILFRMHDSMEKMNRRFPEHSFFRAVPIKIPKDGPATGHELDELIELQKKFAQGPTEAERLYIDRRFPAALLAEIANTEIPAVIESFAKDEKRAVHCVDGRGEEYQSARTALSSAHSIVLDLSALTTISLLEDDFDLARLAARCIVSEGSLECLKQLGKSAAEDERVRGYMGLEGERLVMSELSPERERARAAQAKAFFTKIESLCEIVSGRALARVEAKRRDVMINVFGAETAESVAIAQEHKCPLWTDDYVTGVLGAREFSLQRVWTQAVCLWLVEAESMTSEECDVVSARLCSFNYQFTAVSPSTILVACHLSSWDPDRQPLLGVLDRFGERVEGNDMLVFTASLLPSVWRKASFDSASRVTIRTLDKLSHSSRGLLVIRAILKRLDDLFGLNVVGAQYARTVIEAWLKAGIRGGLIIER